MLRRIALAFTGSLLIAAPGWSQVEVMEPGASGGGAPVYQAPSNERRSRGSSRSSAASADASAELFNQLQTLQDEVMQLRGMVEEQAEQIRQLKQQRLDDNIAIDRRLGGGAGAGAAPMAPTAPIDASGVPTPPADAAMPQMQAPVQPTSVVASSAPAAGEQDAYDAAYALVRDRRFPDATAAFKDFLGLYPNGFYSGNAHYWLGELFLLEGDSDSARTHFEALVNNYPDNRKLPDGMFKLARIYHQEGKAAQAKDLLNRVVNEFANADSSAPRLARDYLQQNF